MNRRLLIHAHIYYHNQIDYIIKKLQNICDCNYKLFVTYNSENDEMFEKFKTFCPDTEFIKVQNVGYDVYPFLTVLKNVNLGDYDYVLKVHTKNCSDKRNTEWRDDLFDALLGNRKIFISNLCVFEQNPEVGMIGEKSKITDMFAKHPESTSLWRYYCRKLNISSDKGNFVAGTIFMCRAKLLQIIKDFDLKEDDFEVKKLETGGQGTLAHVMERMFGVLIQRQGYQIYGAENKIIYPKRILNEILHNIFFLGNKKALRVCKILGIKIKYSRYNYQIDNITTNSIDVYETTEKIASSLKAREIKGLKIKITGKCNRIFVSKSAKFENSEIDIDSDVNDIVIGRNVQFKDAFLKVQNGENVDIKIKDDSVIENKVIAVDGFDKKVEIP